MKNKPYSNQSPKEGWSWETPPDKILGIMKLNSLISRMGKSYHYVNKKRIFSYESGVSQVVFEKNGEEDR